MKKFLCFLFLCSFSFAALSDTYTSGVYEIERGNPHLVKMENGRVVFVSSNHKLKLLQEALDNTGVIQVKVDKKNELLEVEPAEARPFLFRDEMRDETLAFEPTVVSSLTQARNIFNRMKRGWQDDSQCYNRAHVWAWEEFNRTQLNSIKLFLFFTSRYIRNYRYKWWFHVSPMVKVKEGSQIVDRVLDRRYTGGPRYVKTWTDNFIYSRRACPVVQKYSEYRNNQQAEDCYLIPVTMYYWQPRDIDRFERTGFEKQNFIKSEIDWAYWEAF